MTPAGIRSRGPVAGIYPEVGTFETVGVGVGDGFVVFTGAGVGLGFVVVFTLGAGATGELVTGFADVDGLTEGDLLVVATFFASSVVVRCCNT
jgi:hypothetical protein